MVEPGARTQASVPTLGNGKNENQSVLMYLWISHQQNELGGNSTEDNDFLVDVIRCLDIFRRKSKTLKQNSHYRAITHKICTRDRQSLTCSVTVVRHIKILPEPSRAVLVGVGTVRWHRTPRSQGPCTILISGEAFDWGSPLFYIEQGPFKV